MAHTYSALFYHFIYATKNRERWIAADIEQRVWSYHGAVALDHGMKVVKSRRRRRSRPRADFRAADPGAQRCCEASQRGFVPLYSPSLPRSRRLRLASGYAAMTLGRTDLPRVERYIANQRAHHATMTFDEELDLFLKRNGIKINHD